MHATDHPVPARAADSPANTGSRHNSEFNLWAWLALMLFVTSSVAIAVMLVLKWVTGGGEVWPWFTRYAYFAFPAAFLCLVLSLLRTLVQRRRS